MIEYDNYHINRCEALEFLSRNFHDFPEHMPNVREVAEGISENIFKAGDSSLLILVSWFSLIAFHHVFVK